MAWSSVTLAPGVNAEKTQTLNTAQISLSSLIRFKGGLVQKYGGWQKFYPFAIAGKPRDLHAWEDLNKTSHLAIGTTTQLGVVTNGAFQDITPQELTSDFAANFSTTNGQPTVTIVDPNISNVTVYDTVTFQTPVSVGGLILAGVYQITQIVGATTYQITVPKNATGTVNNGGQVPFFSVFTGSTIVTVTFPNHGVSQGGTVVFPIVFNAGHFNITIGGAYTVTTVVDANTFKITASTQATNTGTFNYNNNLVQLLYDIALGPPAVGVGFGLGGFGLGGFGTGVVPNQQTGTEITATDWTSDNWGEILLACPQGGGIYQWDPTGGFQNAALVATAPRYNAGAFVSTTLQLLIVYGSTADHSQDALPGFGIDQDPMLVSWSAESDYTNFVPLSTNAAGSFRIPTGSVIRAAFAALNQNLFWTDLSLWSANWLGADLGFGFSEVGGAAGAVSSHAIQKLRGNVYWMGPDNFYGLTSSGVAVMPCDVWDVVFQNINQAFITNVRAMPNTSFNEVGWLYPSASSSGECDSYVKVNITEPNMPWDYGPTNAMQRSAWIDYSILGPPIAASQGGIVYQQETTNDADGQPLQWSFTTGYFEIGDGEEFAFIDQIYPDFKWGTYAGSQNAQVQMTFSVVNFPEDPNPQTFGPYTVSITTQFIEPRMRGRQMSITCRGSDVGSFVRLGRVRYRWQPDGRWG